MQLSLANQIVQNKKTTTNKQTRLVWVGFEQLKIRNFGIGNSLNHVLSSSLDFKHILTTIDKGDTD